MDKGGNQWKSFVRRMIRIPSLMKKEAYPRKSLQENTKVWGYTNAQIHPGNKERLVRNMDYDGIETFLRSGQIKDMFNGVKMKNLSPKCVAKRHRYSLKRLKYYNHEDKEQHRGN